MTVDLDTLTRFLEVAKTRPVGFFDLDQQISGACEDIIAFDENGFTFNRWGWSAPIPEEDIPPKRVSWEHKSVWNQLFKESNADMYGGVYDWDPLFPFFFHIPRRSTDLRRMINPSEFITKLRHTRIGPCLMAWTPAGTPREETMEFGIPMIVGAKIQFMTEADCIAAKLLTVELGEW